MFSNSITISLNGIFLTAKSQNYFGWSDGFMEDTDANILSLIISLFHAVGETKEKPKRRTDIKYNS